MAAEIWQWEVVCRLTGQKFYVNQPAGASAPTVCPENSAHGVTSVQFWSRRDARVDYSGTLPAPTATDDTSAGWDLGSRILATDGVVYECLDNASGAAAWEERGQSAGACITRRVSSDLIVPSGTTCLQRDMVIADGVCVRIEDGGELVLL